MQCTLRWYAEEAPIVHDAVDRSRVVNDSEQVRTSHVRLVCTTKHLPELQTYYRLACSRAGT